jgi:hypothetical protein
VFPLKKRPRRSALVGAVTIRISTGRLARNLR